MESFEPTLLTLVLLCITAMLAGYLDTLVGGGGLVTIPALLMAGMPPLAALGTNKFQAVTGTATASIMMIRAGKIKIGQIKLLVLTAFIGSLLGALSVQYFDSDALNFIIPIVIVGIAIYFVLVPRAKLGEGEPKISKALYTRTVVPGIGFYDGMFGPATGSFFVLGGVALRGMELIHSTATAKILNFATNFGALLVFLIYGKIAFFVGVIMIVGQIVGASLGARSLLSINPSLLRYLIILICFVMLVSWLSTSGS